jgi:hypothetical protein
MRSASESSRVGVVVKDRVKECGRDTEQFLWFTPAATSSSSPSSSLTPATPPPSSLALLKAREALRACRSARRAISFFCISLLPLGQSNHLCPKEAHTLHCMVLRSSSLLFPPFAAPPLAAPPLGPLPGPRSRVALGANPRGCCCPSCSRRAKVAALVGRVGAGGSFRSSSARLILSMILSIFSTVRGVGSLAIRSLRSLAPSW